MSQDNSADNKRIAKNTLLLYGRMFLSMAISLFTSREILRILGVEDFGVYNVVGGVIAMFSFINASMSGATSRFLTYELGKDSGDGTLKKTFASALLVHCMIALAIVILAETVGLWLLLNKLVIPEGSRFAAMVVYQLSIVSAAIGITQVPYNATLIAHERLDLFAYIDMGNLLLKLVILYILLVLPFNKLIVYAVLVFVVSFGTAIFYRWTAYRLFPEVRAKLTYEPAIVKPMLSYSGWDLYGNMSVTARTTGIQLVLNMFFGPVLNAAAGVASQVQTAVMAFANNITTALKPQIIKSYAAQDYGRTFSLICNGSNLIFALLLFLSLPLIANIDFVLGLWLHAVPDWTTQLTVCTLIFNIFAGMSIVAVTGCHACGHIKRPSLINGSMYLMVVPLTYVCFRWFDGTPVLPYVFNFCTIAIGCLSNAYTCSIHIPSFSFMAYFRRVFAKCMFVAAVCCGIVYIVKLISPFDSWVLFFELSVLSCLATGTLGWCFLCSPSIRKSIVSFVKRKIVH